MAIRTLLPTQARAARPPASPHTAARTRPFAEPAAEQAPVAPAGRGFSFGSVSVAGSVVQRAALAGPFAPRNRTGLPDHVKTGVERLSGVSLDDVSVHYRSPHPRRLGAFAYTQGREIHVAPGKERHVAHEAWHVVQQKRGRVQARFEVSGAPVNDDPGLEHEAELMGARAARAGREAVRSPEAAAPAPQTAGPAPARLGAPLQMAKGTPFSAKMRKQILAANRKANAGLHTCQNGKCGFQHASSAYLKIQKAKRKRVLVGDGSFHIDHVKHFSKGGKGSLANGRVLCGTCNTSRGAGNRIRRTGIKKFPGLHGGGKMRVISETAYKAAMAKYKKSKGKVPVV